MPLDAVEQSEEIEVPPGAAEFAVGCRHKPCRTLLPDDLFDLVVLYGLEMRCADFMSGILRPRPRDSSAAQQAADVIGPERRRGSHRHEWKRRTPGRRSVACTGYRSRLARVA
jgi:hypothetical protein